MNKRIKQLAKQSGFSTELSEAMTTRHNTASGLEKFANLIVQDCIAQVQSLRGYSGYNDEHIVSTPDWNFTLKAVQELLNNMYKES